MRILLFTLVLFSATTGAYAQRAYPIDINSLLSKVPIPRTSADCYAAATKTTDPQNGAISIKDNGAAYQALLDQYDKITRAAITDAMGKNSSSLSTTPPTPEQIEQMKQQAMARAAQMQSMNAQQMAQMHNNPGSAASRPGKEDVELMKMIGDAQSACNSISQISAELQSKIAALDHSAIQNVSSGPNCPEVRQGSYVGPTCACQVEHATAYETRRVAARDALLQKVNSLLAEYIAKLKVQIAIVDDAEAKAKYGDAVTNPAFKQQVVNLQRQALGPVSAVTAFASDNWADAAKQYASLVNAKSGASTGCNRK